MLLRFGAAFTDFPSFAPTLGVMLGLGAGIDYALLIVGRYREQLAAGDTVDHAAAVANSTAGTSSSRPARSSSSRSPGCSPPGIPFVGRMGLGSAIVVAAVAVGAVTVLPTLMGAFAKRLRPKNPAHVAPSRPSSAGRPMLTRRPWTAAIVGTLVLVVLADAGARPAPGPARRRQRPRAARPPASPTTASRRASAPGFNGPLLLAVATAAADNGADTLKRTSAQRRTPGVAVRSRPRAQQEPGRGDARP